MVTFKTLFIIMVKKKNNKITRKGPYTAFTTSLYDVLKSWTAIGCTYRRVRKTFFFEISAGKRLLCVTDRCPAALLTERIRTHFLP